MSRVSTPGCTLCVAAGRLSVHHYVSCCPYKSGQSQLGFEHVRKAVPVARNDTAKDATAEDAIPVSRSNIQQQTQRNHEVVQSIASGMELTHDGAENFNKVTKLAIEVEALDLTNSQFLPKLKYFQALLEKYDAGHSKYLLAHPRSGGPGLAGQRVRSRMITQSLKQSRKDLRALTNKTRLARKPAVIITENRLKGIIRFDDGEAPKILGKTISGKPLKLKIANHRMPTLLKPALKAPASGFETITLSQEDAMVLDENEVAAEQDGEGRERKHRILLATPRTAERVRLHAIGFKTNKRLEAWKYHTTRFGAKIPIKKITGVGELDTITEEAAPFDTFVDKDSLRPRDNVEPDAYKDKHPGPSYSAPLSGGGSRGGVTRRSQVTNARQRQKERLEASQARAEGAMKSTILVSGSDKANEDAEPAED